MKKILIIILCFLLVWCTKKEEQTTKVNIIPNIETNTWTKISWENIKPIENTQNVSSWKLNNQIENKTFSWKALTWVVNTLDASSIINHSWYDFTNDDSLQKFVNNKVSFNNKKYIPSDLEKLSWEYLLDAKNWQYLRHEALLNLQKMSKDFYENFQEKLKIVSAYRSYQYQVWIKSRWCSDLLCAKAWYSEHQTGLAVDLFEATSKDEFLSKADLSNYFDWLNKNAYKYWFTNSYQKWLKVDWYAIEPWHWRYVWEDLATYLSENNLTLAEFVQK